MELKMMLQTILEADVINGFSYSFSRALLEKLKELRKTKRVYVDKVVVVVDGKKIYCLTDIAAEVCHHLSRQIMRWDYSGDTSPAEIDEMIMLCEEFLSIFEKK